MARLDAPYVCSHRYTNHRQERSRVATVCAKCRCVGFTPRDKRAWNGPVVMILKSPAARVLVIDDDRAVVRLEEEGHTVLSALTIEEGLKLIRLFTPDLVLLDMGLPDMSGLEVLKRIRAMHPTLPVIMVTANTDPQRAREALELGARAYIDKPFDVAYLKRVVAMALQGSG